MDNITSISIASKGFDHRALLMNHLKIHFYKNYKMILFAIRIDNINVSVLNFLLDRVMSY